jgi:hypothetical protein
MNKCVIIESAIPNRPRIINAEQPLKNRRPITAHIPLKSKAPQRLDISPAIKHYTIRPFILIKHAVLPNGRTSHFESHHTRFHGPVETKIGPRQFHIRPLIREKPRPKNLVRLTHAVAHNIVIHLPLSRKGIGTLDRIDSASSTQRTTLVEPTVADLELCTPEVDARSIRQSVTRNERTSCDCCNDLTG